VRTVNSIPNLADGCKGLREETHFLCCGDESLFSRIDAKGCVW